MNDAEDWLNYEDDDGEHDEPCGSCEDCGGNLYTQDEKFIGLCDQCEWYRNPTI